MKLYPKGFQHIGFFPGDQVAGETRGRGEGGSWSFKEEECVEIKTGNKSIGNRMERGVTDYLVQGIIILFIVK